MIIIIVLALAVALIAVGLLMVVASPKLDAAERWDHYCGE